MTTMMNAVGLLGGGGRGAGRGARGRGPEGLRACLAMLLRRPAHGLARPRLNTLPANPARGHRRGPTHPASSGLPDRKSTMGLMQAATATPDAAMV
jgi:hypothetical protein